jgi:hypothetical protein
MSTKKGRVARMKGMSKEAWAREVPEDRRVEEGRSVGPNLQAGRIASPLATRTVDEPGERTRRVRV